MITYREAWEEMVPFRCSWAHRALHLALVFFLASNSFASADQQYFDLTGKFKGSYLCTTRNTVGIYFDESLKDWRPSVFENQDSFIVDISENGTSANNSLNQMATSYSIKIIDANQKTASRCTNVENVHGGTPNLIYDHNITNYGRVSCGASLTTYRFNFASLRFVIPYTGDYFLDGIDKKGDTPSLTAGECEKMD